MYLILRKIFMYAHFNIFVIFFNCVCAVCDGDENMMALHEATVSPRFLLNLTRFVPLKFLNVDTLELVDDMRTLDLLQIT